MRQMIGVFNAAHHAGCTTRPLRDRRGSDWDTRVRKTLGATGTHAWRGAEGSITDRESNLVCMQSRHYDPTIGRFIQADSLALTSMTTQGMNRYVYCENDPVNFSDADGMSLWDAVDYAAAGLMIIGGIFLMASGPGLILAGLSAILFGLSLYFEVMARRAKTCALRDRYTALSELFGGLGVIAALGQVGVFVGLGAVMALEGTSVALGAWGGALFGLGGGANWMGNRYGP